MLSPHHSGAHGRSYTDDPTGIMLPDLQEHSMMPESRIVAISQDPDTSTITSGQEYDRVAPPSSPADNCGGRYHSPTSA